ncbi:MAG: hypothetical protein EOP11_19605 [Proteobacteria bacterium]|nr:MAG: hypothetical protein EOP11_19605 [Pseudomonadota bacterium]
MTKFLVAALLLATAPMAHANPSELMTCTTGGDALDSMSLGVNSVSDKNDTVLMVIDGMDESSTSFRADLPKGSLSKALKKGHLDITFRSEKSADFGGATSDAALLVLDKKSAGFSGKLAFSGTVFDISCK